jgi:N-acetylneuraminic acid mutarotase
MPRYDVVTNSWVDIDSLKVGRCFASVSASLDNQFIYIFGGYDGKPLDALERYLTNLSPDTA